MFGVIMYLFVVVYYIKVGRGFFYGCNFYKLFFVISRVFDGVGMILNKFFCYLVDYDFFVYFIGDFCGEWYW